MSLDADVGGGHVGGRHAGDELVGGRPAGDGLASDLKLVVIRATDEEAAAHEAILEKIARIAHSPD
jgi:hypothetical protein